MQRLRTLTIETCFMWIIRSHGIKRMDVGNGSGPGIGGPLPPLVRALRSAYRLSIKFVLFAADNARCVDVWRWNKFQSAIVAEERSQCGRTRAVVQAVGKIHARGGTWHDTCMTRARWANLIRRNALRAFYMRVRLRVSARVRGCRAQARPCLMT